MRVMVGVCPRVVGLGPGDRGTWFAKAATLETDSAPPRSPFASNVFQAPAGVRLSSGPTRSGLNPGSYRYRLSLNDVVVAHGEVLLRGK